MDFLGVGAWAALLLVTASAAAFGGWRFRQSKEEAARRCHETVMREQIAAAGRARDRAKEDAQDVEQRFQRLKDEHGGCGKRIGQLEDRFAAAQAELCALHADLRARDEKLVQLEARLEVGAAEVASLKQQLEAVERLREDLAAARRAHSGCAARDQELRRNLTAMRSRLEVSERQREDSAPGWLLSAPEGAADDLQEMRGLGPVLERSLNGLGIFHFHQLARMTAKDVHWIAGRIGAFPGLAKRYRWVEQARGMAGRHGRGSGNGGNGSHGRNGRNGRGRNGEGPRVQP